MACINSDGKLTQSARQLLESVAKKEQTPEELSKELSVPLFKIRSSLRDMLSMGFVEKNDETYSISEGGKKMLSKN